VNFSKTWHRLNLNVLKEVVICGCLGKPKIIKQYLMMSEVYSIQPYVIKFVSDLRQVSGFLQVLWFPPSIKLAAKI
jgi:hypothetical protein